MKQPITSLPACPVETTLTLLSNRWRAMILRNLLDGTMRFNELRRSVTGISQKVLTSNLREMEDTGLVHREVFAEVPPRVEYSLTPIGQSMRPILDAMGEWGEHYQQQVAKEIA
ncbi:MarR family transcriptional regulator [Corynebacterium striatum]|uniref:winged helix-turn-helix transcriptional regulator n=1 Tax=Corynebacterium striatum TaxID=43770 RepID=UPI000C1CC6CE|nr:helix-turn-helix domain-containing protein [Corynebacterium striatum]MBD0855975.1 transcriptional regulator [Corynebacterium striatum]PIS60446.1 MarR family transcriptional regulator [Corynebacterium striatum]PIS64289.1 MarR family transcriptional regulator [Corynebacterium striatum]PIS65301.1 MarR family transcriptional regulator [Corynebacterium striatum]PIS66660.1 MarR family transcriptional regulator [Corynebacterium striatum]